MKNILIVGIGGFFGSALRYQVGLWFFSKFGNAFPYGTLLVNLLGSLLIGILLAGVTRNSPATMLLLVTGFCGGFTTFSAFSIENVKFLESGNINHFLFYTIASIVGGLGLCALGYFLTQKTLIQ